MHATLPPDDLDLVFLAKDSEFKTQYEGWAGKPTNGWLLSTFDDLATRFELELT